MAPLRKEIRIESHVIRSQIARPTANCGRALLHLPADMCLAVIVNRLAGRALIKRKWVAVLIDADTVNRHAYPVSIKGDAAVSGRRNDSSPIGPAATDRAANQLA